MCNTSIYLFSKISFDLEIALAGGETRWLHEILRQVALEDLPEVQALVGEGRDFAHLLVEVLRGHYVVRVEILL